MGQVPVPVRTAEVLAQVPVRTAVVAQVPGPVRAAEVLAQVPVPVPAAEVLVAKAAGLAPGLEAAAAVLPPGSPASERR